VTEIIIRNPDNSPIEGASFALANTTDRYYFHVDDSGRVFVVNSPDREIQQQYEV